MDELMYRPAGEKVVDELMYRPAGEQKVCSFAVIFNRVIKMTEDEIRELISQGEGPRVEFKREFTTNIDRELVSFVNTGGGMVFIGVDDDATVVGVKEDLRRLEERIQGICRSNCQPPLVPEVSIVQIDSAKVVVVRVEKSHQI